MFPLFIRQNYSQDIQAVSRSLAVQFEELGCFEDGTRSIMTDVIMDISDLTEAVS